MELEIDSDQRSDLTQQQRNHLRETEARLLQRVNEILEPALGKDNLRATVTAELDFNQVALDPVTGEPDPSAYLRMYHDTRQLEATHCYLGRRWQDVIGMFPPPAKVVGHRLRMNTFLGKWLEYLGEQGHGVATLRPAGTARDVA